jgi:ferritin-like metal-binding protein YciE
MMDLRDMLIRYLQDAHAMEQNVLQMLNGMIALSSDPAVVTRLKQHRFDTERHERLVRQRLEALGSSPCMLEDMPAVAAAWLKGMVDMVRSDKPGKNARDAYITEHTEIAAYSLLQRLAERAGDLDTVRVAREICEEEREMAQWIEQNWDKFIDLTLAEDGLRPSWAESSSESHSTRRAVASSLPPIGIAAALGLAGYAAWQLLGRRPAQGTSWNAGSPREFTQTAGAATSVESRLPT